MDEIDRIDPVDETNGMDPLDEMDRMGFKTAPIRVRPPHREMPKVIKSARQQQA